MSQNSLSIPSTIGSFVQEANSNINPNPNANPLKRKRNLPGTPDPDAEVIALSPKSLMATNRFLCEICNKGFQRDQNLQLHRRGHNLPWKLKQRSSKEIKKKVYICPEATCVHHDPSRALGDLTGIKKHYSRKHGEKKWKCEKCSKKYAVQSDWKAHSKICGTREYKCDCGTLFSRKDSFITHRAFCDALAEESVRITSNQTAPNYPNELINGTIGNPQVNTEIPQFSSVFQPDLAPSEKPRLPVWLNQGNSHLDPIGVSGLPELTQTGPTNLFGSDPLQMQWPSRRTEESFSTFPRGLMKEEEEDEKGIFSQPSSGLMSATALLQKAAIMGSLKSNQSEFASFSNPYIRRETQCENLNELMSSIASSNSSSLMANSTRSMDNMIMAANGKNLRGSCSEVEARSFTRDFLGVGGNGGRTFLQEELAKFASMSSAMDLSQYTGNL